MFKVTASFDYGYVQYTVTAGQLTRLTRRLRRLGYGVRVERLGGQ